MIKNRKRHSKNVNVRTITEYFLKVENKADGYLYHDWYTPHEMENLQGCDIKAASIKTRIANKARNPLFDTLAGCVFTQILTTANRDAIRAGAKVRNEVTKSESAFDLWQQWNKLWPAGSLAGEVV